MAARDDRSPFRAEDDALAPLGPPRWSEYAAARRRFTTELALQGLERALSAPTGADREPSRLNEPSR